MSYPKYFAQSDGLKTFMVEDAETVYMIEIALDAEDEAHHYSHCGLTSLSEGDVDMFVEADSEHYDDVCDDVDEVNRVGRRPNIKPPPH